MDKKVRIQLFDPEGRLISDRLVSQDSEFYKGPKEVHQGPLKIEFTLMEKQDVEEVKTFIDKLVGNLPLEASKSTKRVKIETSDIDNREEFLEKVLANPKDQDDLINTLRENGFIFVMADYLDMFEYGIDFIKYHKDKYQWMIRNIKVAKNPKNDKHDPMLLFGINLMERDEKIVIYLNGKYLKKVIIPIPEKPRETFKKTEMLKFPPFMIPEEREKFRIELRALQLQPDKEKSKFFSRWEPYVENLPPIGSK